MLTKNELAKKAGIPASSLKYYIDNFGEYFDPHYVDGRRYPVYSEDSIQLAQLIRDLIGDRKNPDEVRKILEAKGYSPIIEYVESTKLDSQVVNDRFPIDEFSLSSLEASYRAMQVLNRMNDELNNVIEKQESEIQQLKKELEEKNKIIKGLQGNIPQKE